MSALLLTTVAGVFRRTQILTLLPGTIYSPVGRLRLFRGTKVEGLPLFLVRPRRSLFSINSTRNIPSKTMIVTIIVASTVHL